MHTSVSNTATTGTTPGGNVSTEYPWSIVSPTVGGNSTENTTMTIGTSTVATTGTMATSVKPQVTTVFNATTEANATEATNITEATTINATAMLNGTQPETVANTTSTIMAKATTTPTSFPGNVSSTNGTRIESSTPTMTTTTSQANETGATAPARSSTAPTATTPRTSTRRTTFPSTATPPPATTYTAAHTTWSVPSRGPGATTASPQLLTGKNLYIGAGAVAAGVMLVIIIASVFCTRRRKHSKCRKLAEDDGNINAYEVEMANRLGADNIGATLVESDDAADNKPETRNYFQDGLRSEENNSSTAEGETPERRTAHPSGIKTEDRLSVGPVMLSDSSGSTQETYDRAYSTHDTFKN